MPVLVILLLLMNVVLMISGMYVGVRYRKSQMAGLMVIVGIMCGLAAILGA